MLTIIFYTHPYHREQIIAPSGTRLNKSTGSTEGVGVIEAILSWWKTVRGGNNEDTSANLFKKSAALTDQEREDFIKYVKEASISTASSSAHATLGKAAVTSDLQASKHAQPPPLRALPVRRGHACLSRRMIKAKDTIWYSSIQSLPSSLDVVLLCSMLASRRIAIHVCFD